MLKLRRSRERALLVGLFLLPVLMIYRFYRSVDYPPDFVAQHPYFNYDLDSLEPRLASLQSCVLPRVHPFHPSVWGYIPSPLRIVCKSRWTDLTHVDGDGVLRFNDTVLLASGHEVGRSLSCSWSDVIRGGKDQESDVDVEYGPEVTLDRQGVLLTSDIVRVRCWNVLGLTVHDVIHAHIRDVKTIADQNLTKDRLNVLIFGVDSLSRLSFIRLLPRTFRYLTEDLGMHVFRGMNKVGDNTFPNLIALLTGQAAYGGRLPSESDFDHWPLIWNNYSSAGYATLWAEDFIKFGLFNYLADGFRHSPTLHYLRPFWLALKESPVAKSSPGMCYGNVVRYMLQLDYVRRFVTQYRTKKLPFFGFSFLAEVSHEYISSASAADDDFLDFFRFLKDGGHLEDTLLIVMSDHGHRFDAIRSTWVGHLEERLPFFGIHVPKKLLSKYPDVERNLKVNEGRLVTPFDIHATLVDLLNHVTKDTSLGVDKSIQHDRTLGVSMFGPVSSNRTCSDASVPINFCVCETEEEISTTDSRAESSADFLIEHINKMLEGRVEPCALLGLGQLKSAYLVRTPEDKEGSFVAKVRVVIEAKPSQGLFEATIQLDGQSKSVLGDVSRINPYEGQSDCIQHATLRKFCFCVAQSQAKL